MSELKLEYFYEKYRMSETGSGFILSGANPRSGSNLNIYLALHTVAIKFYKIYFQELHSDIKFVRTPRTAGKKKDDQVGQT